MAADAANAATAVAYSPNGSIAAVGADDGAVFLYRAKTGNLVRTLTGHMGPVSSLAFSPKGDILATGSRDSTVLVWRVKNGKQLRVLHGQEQAVRSLAFDAEGAQLLVGGEDTRSLLWQVSTGKLQHVFGSSTDFVTAVAASPDGKTLATATRDARITLRSAKTFAAKGTLLGHSGEITSLEFAPDGSTLASGSTDKSVKVWKVSTRSQARSMRGAAAVNSVAFSPSGASIAAGLEDGSVEIWNPASGSQKKKFTAPGAVKGLAFSPDGSSLLEGRANGVASSRDVATGTVTESTTLPEPATSTTNPRTTPSATDPALRPSATDPSLRPSAVKPTGRTLGGRFSARVPGTAPAAPLAAAIPAADSPLASGPGGPILIVTESSDPFSQYYAEILRAEGLNAFTTVNLSEVTASSLTGFDVVVLAARSLSPSQVTTFSAWTSGGGNLVAMRPDAQLADLLGLSPSGATLSDAYLKVDTSTRPGNGIVGETIQYHGTADTYSLAGARAVASLYANATTATTSPAVTLHDVGTQGGQAAAFAFDLARSIVYTRQGNPAWNGQERDGLSPIRSDDLYYGNKSGDVQADWIDLTKVEIPQADEQQRLLVNLILEMNADRTPLPRFWYLPRGLKAAVIMTGDDHGNNGTEGRFDQLLAESPASCSVADWECIRGTSYIYPSTPLSSAKATEFANQGFEIALHVSSQCQDYTPASLASDYATQLQEFAAKYPGVPDPATNRTHCIAWSDWSTQADVELSNGIRLDTNYYYWPPTWAQDRPGFFTGSGIPMRFTDTNGAMIDVYQAASQMTDESGQTYPYTIDTLLDKALGPEGYYGAFTINAHTDAAEITESTSTIASAKARGVPVVTAKQMLDWVDARNASSFKDLSWSTGQLTFSVAPGSGARNLDMLVPAQSGNSTLSSVSRDGTPVTYETRTVKGSVYALVSAKAGAYVATYQADATAPTATGTTPSDGATGASLSTAVTASFSESLDPATVSSNTFSLTGPSGSQVAATVAYDGTTRSAILTPASSLTPSTAYQATLKGGTTDPRIKDLAGNALAADKTWTFTTESGPSCPCSVWPSSATPTNASVADPNAVELGVKFRSDVDGFITGVRFYKGAQNTGTHVGSLWSTAGVKLATATFTNESGSGWQQVTFATPVAVTANTTYVASYHAPNGNYAADNSYFATTGVDNAPLHALSTGAATGNGLYAYSATSTFPGNTWQGSNYWVDVVFTTSTGPDTTPPTVTSTTPTAGATDVATTAAVSAAFSESLDPASVSSSTFSLTGPGGSQVSATVAYDNATRTATLTPASALAPDTQYQATIRGGGTDPRIKDLAGNALAADKTWTFTTAAPVGQGCPCSIWPSSATPVNASENDPNAVELGVKFRSDVDGFITGVRFYKGAENTGTHTGSLWSTAGVKLATATFTNESGSGWQQVTFAAPVAVTANTTYVASYHAPSGNYAGDNSYFATTGVDNAPLHALSTGAANGNGLYAYSATSTFPTNTWQGTNYWVDVVFTTSTGPDTTPPTVTSTTPTAGATDVATNSRISATFNESLDPSTVSGSTAGLTGPGGTAIPTAVTYDPATRAVVIQPSTLLTPLTPYTATIKGGGTDPRIKDVAGNALAANKTWTFTTAPPGPCDNPANEIVAENCRPGSPSTEWDVSGAGDPSIQGFATNISVDQGQSVDFKVDTPSSKYRIDIYRLGYYDGAGARKVATVEPTATLPQAQPACLEIDGTTNDNLIDCGNWGVSGSWAVPGSAVSGVYIARPVREDGADAGKASHIVFIVRDDDGGSDVLVQTSDTTWQAYNGYGGYSLYANPGHAHKVSYNRPFTTRANPTEDWVFNAEYPMIRWLERNGYDVSYFTDVDSDRNGEEIKEHKTFMSVGHDEYWSGGQRANVEAARDAGVNLAFLSGNEIYWKTRWELSTVGGASTDHRTLVAYKEGDAQGSAEHYDCYQNFACDPDPTTWTGLWRQNATGHDGGKPENALSGQISWGDQTSAIQVPAADGSLRFWRDAGISSATTLAANTLGYEFDWEQPAYASSNPAGRITLSDTTAGGKNHRMSLYRAPSGALVFGAGTVQWSWGLDATHDRGPSPTDPRIQQATVNLLADMSAQPSTLQSGLVKATKSTDTSAPAAAITSPTDGSQVGAGANVTISGTATDTGGGRVGGVEVSTDNGVTWAAASGRASWTFTWAAPVSGSVTLKARATDDSGNLQPTPASATIGVGDSAPATPTGLTATATPTGITLDWADTTGATGYNVYRAATANGTYTKITTNQVTTSSYDDTTAPIGTTYYKVTAVNTAGESTQSNPANATRVAAPATPTGLTATATPTGITLDWADTTGATGYNVYRASTSGGPFTKVNGAPMAASDWDDTMAPSGTSTYQVTAITSGAESGASNQANSTMTKPILLLNPSFELDANSDNRPDSWTSSARFLRTTAAARSGTYAGTHSGNNAGYTVGQTRTGLTAGTAYTVAGWVNIPATTDAFTFSVQIQWRSTASNVISTQTVTSFNAATSGWLKVGGTYTAPAGTTRAVVNMVASSLRGPIHVDDLTLR
ncbi:MAG: DUF4082 domain-containing protein [Candidatus Nanopelagicales bacterium]